MNTKIASLSLAVALVALSLATHSTAAPSDPQLSWFTCGSCPNPPEVSISANTITMGNANQDESGEAQPRSYHGAAALLPPAGQYIISFDYDLYTWDSYFAPTEAGKGYWDSFSISVSSQPIWQISPPDPITPDNLPGLGFIWGGSKWEDHILKHTSGSKTIVVEGNPSGDNYLSVVLDTVSEPNSDPSVPSWGTITIRSIETDTGLDNIRQLAVENAKAVAGGQYLRGGKGWNWTSPAEYVSAQKILADGYYYYQAATHSVVWGKGLDCSGLIYWSYARAAGSTTYPGSIIYQESAQGQRDSNSTPISESELRPGDLLFFSNSAQGTAITHVAMYAGGNDPGKDVVEAANPAVGITYSSKDQRKTDSRFRGFGRVRLNQPPLIVQTHSPVTLIVTDPGGSTVTSDSYVFTGKEYIRGIPGVLYYTTDENGDDLVYAPALKAGIYTIDVIPEPDANPNDTFSLEVLGAARLLDLAQNTRISDIPPQGYRIIASNGEINPSANKVFLPFIGKDGEAHRAAPRER